MNIDLKIGKDVLLVEDDRETLEAMSTLLQYYGYSLATAENGQQALDYLRACQALPQVILLDMTMPVMDGREFLTIQCRDQELRAVPVVTISAIHNCYGLIEEYGVAHCLNKPVDLARLFELLARYCDA
ncbi:MAG: response regulator [Bradymonadaceae bacterium]|nr:response regulator [Lujinxingiaceae bacterium]